MSVWGNGDFYRKLYIFMGIGDFATESQHKSMGRGDFAMESQHKSMERGDFVTE